MQEKKRQKNEMARVFLKPPTKGPPTTNQPQTNCTDTTDQPINDQKKFDDQKNVKFIFN